MSSSGPPPDSRQKFWQDTHPPWDVVIIGGGIQGARIFHELSRRGRRVLLLDQADFAGGTSQASAMLIWGGLLYLRHAAVREAVQMSRARDSLLNSLPDMIQPHMLRYVYGSDNHRPRPLVQSVLWMYWLLGGCRRRRPRIERSFPEKRFLHPSIRTGNLCLEEARVLPSDAAFVLHWIRCAITTRCHAFNYCRVAEGGFDRAARLWQLHLHDMLSGQQMKVRANWIVNAAGVGADSLNAAFNIRTPVRHFFSKGVTIAFERHPLHRDTIMFDSGWKAEGMTLVPWGPVSMWGSTEVAVTSPHEGRAAQRADVNLLLDEINGRLASPIEPRQIISLRCGVRPLVVRKGDHVDDPLKVSRRWCVLADAERPWISVFGGKITTSILPARRVASIIGYAIGSRNGQVNGHPQFMPPAELRSFPGLPDPVPAPQWCRQHQYCRTLEDYLRRRTNIAQWIPRGGLGRCNENLAELLRIARVFCDDDVAARSAVQGYQQRIEREFDDVVSASTSMEAGNA